MAALPPPDPAINHVPRLRLILISQNVHIEEDIFSFTYSLVQRVPTSDVAYVKLHKSVEQIRRVFDDN